ncbi:MAG TPA: DUF4389 domain-containing protein [Oxalobacteraceae bacterium]|nr:DUF4389 domain-containing protein [Oxalobacteraceae bacterium]HCN90482.1 DUF4389 domain-containing protein [Oxalobacteraceae bacterium]
MNPQKGSSVNENSVIATNKRNLWTRALFMVLMAFVFQLCGTLLFIVAILQLAISLVSDGPNQRLRSFGRSLGHYLQQIALFLTFGSEDIPFPFNDWPSGD